MCNLATVLPMPPAMAWRDSSMLLILRDPSRLLYPSASAKSSSCSAITSLAMAGGKIEWIRFWMGGGDALSACAGEMF